MCPQSVPKHFPKKIQVPVHLVMVGKTVTFADRELSKRRLVLRNVLLVQSVLADVASTTDGEGKTSPEYCMLIILT